MLRRLFYTLVFTTFLFISSSKPTFAAIGPAGAAADVVNTFSDIQDYCNSRSGDVMNLETWYSGKCPDKTVLQAIFDTFTLDTFSQSDGLTQRGAFRGFSDIVLLDFMTKFIPENPADTFSLGVADASAIPSLTRMLTSVITSPPASGVSYLAHINNNLEKHRLVKPAYAQATGAGLGFNKLLPILPAWSGMRNIAYTMFILIFVLYGFMLMFRTKINAQTVINFELAIPKLVVTLLAITFSYAIAGFIIDLSLLLPAFIVSILQGAQIIDISMQIPFADSIQPVLSRLNIPLDLSTQSGTDYAVKVITGQTPFGGAFLGFQILYEILFTAGVSSIASLLTGLPTILYGAMFTVTPIGAIIKLILIIAFFFVLLKIAFMAIQAYAAVVISIIFSPIILLGNVLPGSQSFSGWIRNLAAHISVFPSITIMFMLAISFMGISSPINNEDMWVPPYFAGSTEGWPLGSNSAVGVGSLLAYALIFLTPKVADMIRDALKVPAFKYGSAIGEALNQGYRGERWASTHIAEPLGRRAVRDSAGGPLGGFVSGAQKYGAAGQKAVDAAAGLLGKK